MRVLSVVGARPQFVKLAPIARAMRGRAEHLIAHTGQHYDHNMSDVFFAELGIPAPEFNLGVGSGKHGEQTGAMLGGVEQVIEDTAPDWVLVYGDTNSTLAAAIAAVKLHVPVAHLEAGLRSFNRRMPEEHNRVLTDHAADLLLAPTQVAMDHLATEGLAERAVLVGDVMTDVLFRVRDQVVGTPLELAAPVEPGEYYVATTTGPTTPTIRGGCGPSSTASPRSASPSSCWPTRACAAWRSGTASRSTPAPSSSPARSDTRSWSTRSRTAQV